MMKWRSSVMMKQEVVCYDVNRRSSVMMKTGGRLL